MGLLEGRNLDLKLAEKEDLKEWASWLQDPGFSSVYIWKARAHERVGNFDQAIEDAKKVVEMQGNAGLGKLHLASTYARAGKREQAVELLEEFQSDTSGDYSSPTFVGMVKFDLGQ